MGSGEFNWYYKSMKEFKKLNIAKQYEAARNILLIYYPDELEAVEYIDKVLEECNMPESTEFGAFSILSKHDPEK